MCIVSFVLENDGFTLTFNRDEDSSRLTEPPKWHKNIFCPTDLAAGGTWIGYNTRIIACLQNGARIKHMREPSYLRSRGLILKEVMEAHNYETQLNSEKFLKIEPFTLSIFDIRQKLLFIYRFDGLTLDKVVSTLENPVIISSSTLYDSLAQKTIENDFVTCKKDPKSVFYFHDRHRIGSPKNKFTKLVSTVSITQFRLEKGNFCCHYFDSINNNHIYF